MIPPLHDGFFLNGGHAKILSAFMSASNNDLYRTFFEVVNKNLRKKYKYLCCILSNKAICKGHGFNLTVNIFIITKHQYTLILTACTKTFNVLN